jgi:hypothetical protein
MPRHTHIYIKGGEPTFAADAKNQLGDRKKQPFAADFLHWNIELVIEIPRPKEAARWCHLHPCS